MRSMARPRQQCGLHFARKTCPCFIRTLARNCFQKRTKCFSSQIHVCVCGPLITSPSLFHAVVRPKCVRGVREYSRDTIENPHVRCDRTNQIKIIRFDFVWSLFFLSPSSALPSFILLQFFCSSLIRISHTFESKEDKLCVQQHERRVYARQWNEKYLFSILYAWCATLCVRNNTGNQTTEISKIWTTKYQTTRRTTTTRKTQSNTKSHSFIWLNGWFPFDQNESKTCSTFIFGIFFSRVRFSFSVWFLS